MNIEANRSNIQLEENLSIRSNKVEHLNDNLSTSYCPSFSFSYEIKNELKTELYGKENADARKFNLLKIPNFIKDYSRHFVDNLFLNEINKNKSIKSFRACNLTNTPRHFSKFYTFFNNLSKSIEKRKSEYDSKLNDHGEEQKDVTRSHSNLNIKEDQNEFADIEKNYNFNFNENENLKLNNILHDLPEIPENEFTHNMDNSFNNDFNDIIHKSFASKGNNLIEKFELHNSNENSNLGEFKNSDDFFVGKDEDFAVKSNQKAELAFALEEDFDKEFNEFENEIKAIEKNDVGNERFEKKKLNDVFNVNRNSFNSEKSSQTGKKENIKCSEIDSKNDKDKLLAEDFANSLSIEEDNLDVKKNGNREKNSIEELMVQNASYDKNINSKYLSDSENKLSQSEELEENDNDQEEIESEDENSAAEDNQSENEQAKAENSKQAQDSEEAEEPNQIYSSSSSSYQIKVMDDPHFKDKKELSRLHYVKKTKIIKDAKKKDLIVKQNEKNNDGKENKQINNKQLNKAINAKVDGVKENIKTQKQILNNMKNKKKELIKESKNIKKEKKLKSKNKLVKNQEEELNIKKSISNKLTKEKTKENFKSKEKLRAQENKVYKDEPHKEKTGRELVTKKETRREILPNKNKISQVIGINSENNFLGKTQSQEKQIINKFSRQQSFTVETTKKSQKNLNKKSKEKIEGKSHETKQIQYKSNNEVSESEEEEEKVAAVVKGKKALKALDNNKNNKFINKNYFEKQFKNNQLFENTINIKSTHKHLDEDIKNELLKMKEGGNNVTYSVNGITKASKSPEKQREAKSLPKTQSTKANTNQNYNSKKKLFEEKLLTPNANTNDKLKSENEESDLELSKLSEIAREKLLNKRLRAHYKKTSKRKFEFSTNVSFSPNKKNKNETNAIKKTGNTSSYFFEAKQTNSAYLNFKSTNNNTKYSRKPGDSENKDDLSDDKKLKKLMEIKKQIAKKKELQSFKNKKEENEINSNKKFSVNFPRNKSNSLKKINSNSGLKTDLESKSESTNNNLNNNNGNKRFSNVMSAISNPMMSLNEEIELIFKKIKLFKEAVGYSTNNNNINKENHNNNLLSYKNREGTKGEFGVANYKQSIKEFNNVNNDNLNSELENNFSLKMNNKEAEKVIVDLNPKLTTLQKIDQIKKNFINQFINKKSLNNEKKDSIDFKEEFKQLHNNNLQNDTFNNNIQIINKTKSFIINNNMDPDVKEKSNNDLVLPSKDNSKNLIPNINSNLFKQQNQSSVPFNSNSKNIENIGKNKFENTNSFGNIAVSDKNNATNNHNNHLVNKENLVKINNDNLHVNKNKPISIYYPDSKVNYRDKDILTKAISEIQNEIEKNKVDSQKKELTKTQKLGVNLLSEDKHSKSPKINNASNIKINPENPTISVIKDKVNEIKNYNNINNINNPKDVMKIQIFQDLIKKNKNKNKEIQFEYNDTKDSRGKDEKEKFIKKISSLNIMLKKDANFPNTNVVRKPSTANIPAKKNNFNSRVGSPLDKYTKSVPLNNQISNLNNLNVQKSFSHKKQSEKHLQAAYDFSTKEKKEFWIQNQANYSGNNFLKMPILNKDSVNITNSINFNTNSNKIERNKNHFSPNSLSKQNESLNNNLIRTQDNRGKITYNPHMPNINKFEKIYQNYKEQEKSLKEIKANNEAESKIFYPIVDNIKVNNLNIRVINS